jgi:hypothetical protein
MKPVLNWVKGNVLIVVCGVVAIAAFPVLYVLGSGKSSALLDEVSSEVASDQRSLQGLTANYSIPTLDPNQPPIEFSRVPNEATTRAALAAIERVKLESTEVLEAATEFNRGSYTLLVEGLLPEPTEGEWSMRQRFGTQWVPAHSALLQRANAGDPPEVASVEVTVEREVERVRNSELGGRTAAQLSAEESQTLLETGRAARLGIYRDQATQYTVYSNADVFGGVVEPEATSPPELAEIWDMQHRFWVHELLVEAIARANTDERGLLMEIPDAPIKNVLSIQVDNWNLAFASDAQPASPIDVPLSPDYDSSPTGRAAWPSAPNSLYDIRYAQLVMHVRSDAVASVLDVFNSTNLMSVVSCSLKNIDQQEWLAQGYYYGGGHVVEMRFRVETLWLRTWTSETMPDAIKRALGVPVEGAAPVDEFGQDQY